MARPDKILCALAQNDDGSINGIGGPFGDFWHPVHDASRPARIIIPSSLVPTAEIADTLKLSGITGKVDVEVQGDIYGGYEDCVDATKCKGDVTVSWTGTAYPKGNFLSTIKGETDGFTLRGKVSGHGRETDVDLGNNYSVGNLKLNGKTRNVRLELESPDCIKVRPLSADNPKLLNAGKQCYKVDKWSRVFWPLYLRFCT